MIVMFPLVALASAAALEIPGQAAPPPPAPILRVSGRGLAAAPGYRFERGPGGQTRLVAARAGQPGGGNGVVATFNCSCNCTAQNCSGSCTVPPEQVVLLCVSEGCTGNCTLSIVSTTGIAAARLLAITPELQRLPCDVRINGRSVRSMPAQLPPRGR